MPGSLFVVGTPIGNLSDISQRALETLRGVERVVAEDTRRSRALLTHFGIKKPLSVLEAHSSPASVAKLAEQLQHGDLALLTDAGMPGISDPGAALVQAARRQGHRVVPIPGPSAVTAAVAASGLVLGPFTFLGFLARKGQARSRHLERIGCSVEPVVLFEAPGRTQATLLDLARAEPERRACVARELTKWHEELVWGSLSELSQQPAERWRGEITLVLGPGVQPDTRVDNASLERRMRAELKAGKPTRQLAIELAPWAGRSRRELYQLLLELGSREDADP